MVLLEINFYIKMNKKSDFMINKQDDELIQGQAATKIKQMWIINEI